MPMPKPDETEEDFIKRCIPVVLEDGSADSQDQAVAMCSSMWEQRDKEKGKMEFSTPLKIMDLKSITDDWEVEGYGSTFNNVDLGNGMYRDKVIPGAFSWTLKDGPKPSFLLSHDPRLVLGPPKELREDKNGLFNRFKISKTQLGSDTRQLLLDGAIDSFSIGYEALDWEIESEDIRVLKKIKLYEVSLVPFPMNPKAVVTGVKAELLPYLPIRDQIDAISTALSSILNDLRVVVEKDRPLSEAKRKEIMELLETFSGMDAVRAEFQSVLAAVTPKVVSSRLTAYKLAEARRRLTQKNVL